VVPVNTNVMKPPVALIALGYLAGALCGQGYRAEVLDLNLAEWGVLRSAARPDRALDPHGGRRGVPAGLEEH